MAVGDYELCEAWKTTMSLCRVMSGDNVAILTDRSTNQQNLAAATNALKSMGAVVTRIDLQPVNSEQSLSRDPFAYLGTTPLTGNRTALAACKASDFVLDLMVLLYSSEQQEILNSGVRILLAVEPPEVLVRLLPTLEDKARVGAAATILKRASTMRVTSSAGTDIVFGLGQYPPVQEYGFSEEKGRWDHWPSGFILTWPNEGASNGRIVIDRGDIVLPQKRYVGDPITLKVENGYVTEISGQLDAELLRNYMAHFDDPESYAFSHIGWGLQKRASWTTLSLYDREQTVAMDARAFAGNFLFSLGPNLEVGGTRNTACHIDVPLRGCTVMLDGRPVVQQGVVVEDGRELLR
jgi:2,5-dihydroxypyridine 5,6-dioxygenase